MSLQNLAKIGQLNAHKATAAEVALLLDAVRRNIADAEATSISSETRFDCGYKAVMQCALIAMMVNGYRPSTGAPGHHQTMMQSLPLTLGVGNDTWIVLDALRKKRNQNDYTGVPMHTGEAQEAVARAKELFASLQSYLRARHPQLLR